MYDEYNKISLHNHFGGYRANRTLNSNNEYFFYFNIAKDQINSAKINGFKILGTTQHNIFKKEDYIELQNYSQENGILLLPGVELDLVMW